MSVARRVPPTGWHVEIETASGTTLRPTLLEVTPDSSLNDAQRIEVVVPEDDRWFDTELQRQPMRVWKDGERQPIERFERPVRYPDRVVLHGRGGVALDTDTEFDIAELQDVDDVVRDLVSTDTPYTANVDDPSNNVRDDIRVLSASTLGGLKDAFPAITSNTENEIPVKAAIEPRRLELTQIAWLRAANFATKDTTAGTILDDGGERFMNDRSYLLQSAGDYIEATWDAEYEVLRQELNARLRHHVPNGDGSGGGLHPAFEVSIDGYTVEEVPENVLTQKTDPSWLSIFTQNVPDDVVNGNFTVRVEVTSSGTNDQELYVDGLAAWDDRYSSDLDWSQGVGAGSIDENGIIQGPAVYPASIQMDTEDRTLIEQVVGGRFTADSNNIEQQQALAISNDNGETWVEASNAEEVLGDFASSSTQIRGRVTLSRYDDDPTTHPAQGDGGQLFTEINLYANLDDTPFVQGSAFDGSQLEVLQQLADNHNFIFELAWDDAAETLSVEWTQPGQRQTSTSAAVLDYQSEVDAETIVEKAVVYGRSRRVRDKTVTLFYDSFQGVGDGYLQPGTERVADPSTGEVYDYGDDYEILFNEGVISAVEGGAISDGQDVVMDFETRLTAEYELPDADGSGDTIRVTVEEASTVRLAEQAAMALVKRLSDPRHSARVDLDPAAGFGLVGALDIEDSPVDPEYVSNLTETNDRLRVLLGNEQTSSQVVNDIRRRISAVAKRL